MQIDPDKLAKVRAEQKRIDAFWSLLRSNPADAAAALSPTNAASMATLTPMLADIRRPSRSVVQEQYEAAWRTKQSLR